MSIITKTAVAILEVSSSFYPEKTGIFSPDQNYILPSQETWAQFGGNKDVVCGPSPFINTLNCFSTRHKNFIKSVPIPGNLSTTPIFYDDSWIIGTTKGFLIRIKAESQSKFIPSVSPASTELWGSYSRDVMESFVAKTVYKDKSQTDKEIKKNTESSLEDATKFSNYTWVFPTSSPFTGTPIIYDNYVYGITASQSLQAIDLESGKLIWSIRINAESSFYLANNSLLIENNNLLVSSNRGDLLVLNPKTGDQIKKVSLQSSYQQESRFPNIVAAPLSTDSNHIIVSNALSETKKITLSDLNTVWSYTEGSVNTAIKLNSAVFLLTSNGKVVRLDDITGNVDWSTDININSPLIAGTLINDNKTLLVATQRGNLLALDISSGKILAQNRPIGSVVGSFFDNSYHKNETCLTFSTGSFRCFRVKQ